MLRDYAPRIAERRPLAVQGRVQLLHAPGEWGDALYVSIKSDEDSARTPPGRVVGTDDSRFLALLSFRRCLFKLGRTPSSEDHAPRMLTWTRLGTVTDRSTETNLHITCGAW